MIMKMCLNTTVCKSDINKKVTKIHSAVKIHKKEDEQQFLALVDMTKVRKIRKVKFGIRKVNFDVLHFSEYSFCYYCLILVLPLLPDTPLEIYSIK